MGCTGKRNHLYRTGRGFGKIFRGKINFNLLEKFNENVAALSKFKNVIDSFYHQSMLVKNSLKCNICKYNVYKFLDSFPNEKFILFASNSFTQLNQSKIFSNVTKSLTSNTSPDDLKNIIRDFNSHVTPGLLISYPLKKKLNLPFVKQIIHYDIPADVSDLVNRLSLFKTKFEYDSDELIMGNSLILYTKNDLNGFNNILANMANKFQQMNAVDYDVLVKYFINRYQHELITGINLKVDVSSVQLENAQKLLNIYGNGIVKSALHKLDAITTNFAWRSVSTNRYNYASVIFKDPCHAIITSRSQLKQLLTLHLKDKIDFIGKIIHTNNGFVVEIPVPSALEITKTPLCMPEDWGVKSKITAEILQEKPAESEKDRKRIIGDDSTVKQIKRKLNRGYISNPKTRRKLLKKLVAANERREISLLRRRAKLGLVANKLTDKIQS